ncbi:hypothetical protein HMPREF9714_03356 [Myroides odoratimimus CCUG 12901]|uniref:hypothetical protein n=1 Tax=Myroides odoratimimus TaxID=76832 RepID=UPI000246115B|nr:hypothetical protein [Myroides odoratimimus]EHO05418.1 hypothetical protein HMPREF9714_03356 [Myroides odoratimimus CCUG 12901]
MSLKRYFTLRKIALYKFLGKFIPYFKNKLYMSLLNLKESIKNEINSVLKDEFKGGFYIKDVSDSTIDKEYVNIFDGDCGSSMEYGINRLRSAKLCFIMNMLHNNLPIKVTIIYFENDFEIKFKVPEVSTKVFDDCKMVENLLIDKKHLLLKAFNSYSMN